MTRTAAQSAQVSGPAVQPTGPTFARTVLHRDGDEIARAESDRFPLA